MSLGLHRAIIRVSPIAQGTAGNDALGFCRSLPLVGATHEKPGSSGRNVITAAGVSSGIVLRSLCAAEIAGETAARKIQLGIEYDPAPPFDSRQFRHGISCHKVGVIAQGYDKSLWRIAQASTGPPGFDRIGVRS